MRALTLTVNGTARSLLVPDDAVLLDVLREDLGLHGAKRGCGRGECGACTVLVDGRPVASCIYPAHKARGCTVQTIEGLARGDALHALQRWFVELGAVQCGFCTPGMLMSAKALLDANHSPSEAQIRQAITGNLCRCTGYVKIVAAIGAAAAELRGEPRTEVTEVQAAEGLMGRRLAKADAVDKARGRAQYVLDLQREGQLHAAVVTSPHAHARLLSINPSLALGMPGVAAFLAHADIPGERDYGLIVRDQPYLPYDRVRYVGEPVALVLAETQSQARAAARRVEVAYEPLAAVMTPHEARGPGAPQLFDSRPGNLLFHRKIEVGDVGDGFQLADVIVSRRFSTQTVEHAYMEPESALAYWEGDCLVVLSGCQSPHYVQGEVARMLALPLERVRIAQVTTGGAFGGKVDLTVQHLVALGTYVTGRPVKLVWSRGESIQMSTKRHAHEMRYRVGATNDGRLVAADVEIVANSGAYASFGGVVITRSCLHSIGPYECPNVRVNGFAVHTNLQVAGAMRGFGVPQVAVCHEAIMDEIAQKCGLTSVEVRRRNMLQPGSRTVTGQVLGSGAGALQALETVSDMVDAGEGSSPVPEGTLRGKGIACIYYGNGTTAKPEPTAATVTLTADGHCQVFSTATELGQGLDTAFAQLAAETLGTPVDSTRVGLADTASCVQPGAGWSPGQTYVLGNAVCLAAAELRRMVVSRAAEVLQAPIESLDVREGLISAGGNRLLTVAEVCESLQADGIPLSAQARFIPETSDDLDPQTGQGEPYGAYSYAGQGVEVEVDAETGEYRVVRVVAAEDVGRVINPMTTEAQVQGAVAMGLGFGMMEEVAWSGGRLLTDGLDTYLVPTVLDVPPVEVRLLEVPEPTGPFGAKAVGEPAVCPTAAALVNALQRATGVRLDSLPVTAEKLYWKMHGQHGAEEEPG